MKGWFWDITPPPPLEVGGGLRKIEKGYLVIVYNLDCNVLLFVFIYLNLFHFRYDIIEKNVNFKTNKVKKAK